MRAPIAANPLAVQLARRIREQGPMTFAEYMEACLYDPEDGYYTRADQRLGRDYFTSADIKPLFGRLLARQFEEMWAALGRPDPFWLVEAGAGAGALAKAILDFTAGALPEFHAGLRYIAVERSPARRKAQEALLEPHARSGRFSASSSLPEEISAGCIFSNELLDALPVHRLVREGGELKELYVAVENGRLTEWSGPLSSPPIADYFARQHIELREEQQAEVCLAACDWIRHAGERLGRGFVLTIDYGREAEELYNELHMRGTLLAYQAHRAGEDFFRAPGEQDLTAHVNFTALDLWGREAGLVRTGLATQSNFLLALARKSDFADVEIDGATEAEKKRQRLLLKTLINPEGMGETFQVLIQHKGIAAPALAGLQPL